MDKYRVRAYERGDEDKVWHPIYAHHRTGIPTFDRVSSTGVKNRSILNVLEARAAKRKYRTNYVVQSILQTLAPDVTGDRDVVDSLLEALQRAADIANSEVHILSGGRTTLEQEYLYNGYINGLPGFAPANRPGTSMHEYDPRRGETGGRAADAYIRGVPIGRVLTDVQLAKAGLKIPYASEQWHVEEI